MTEGTWSASRRVQRVRLTRPRIGNVVRNLFDCERRLQRVPRLLRPDQCGVSARCGPDEVGDRTAEGVVKVEILERPRCGVSNLPRQKVDLYDSVIIDHTHAPAARGGNAAGIKTHACPMFELEPG